MNDTLFELPSPHAARPQAEVKAEPRVQRPNRLQIELRPVDLEGLLPADHRARVVWDFVEGVDLTPLYGEIKAVEGPGASERGGSVVPAPAGSEGAGAGYENCGA